MKTIKLPQFKSKFAGQLRIYNEGDVVQNPFSGETYELNAEELSVYDYILGLQYVIDRVGGAFSPQSFEFQKDLRVGLDWFRKHNAEAYMVLLD
jgi:hypothetical protein